MLNKQAAQVLGGVGFAGAVFLLLALGGVL